MPVTQLNGIIFIEKSFLDIYCEALPAPLRFAFPADSVEYMEIISKDNFTNELKTFLTSNKVSPFAATVLLSDHFLFCKEITTENASVAKEAEDVKQFLDATPFEEVLSKIYRLDRREIIAATNQTFIEVLEKVLTQQGSRIDACVPTFLLGKNFSFQNGLVLAQAKMLISRLNNIKPWSLPWHEEIEIVPPPSEPTAQAPANSDQVQTPDADAPVPAEAHKAASSNKRVFLLAGVFLFLFLILAGMFFNMMQQNSKVVRPTPTPTALPQQAQPKAQASEVTPPPVTPEVSVTQVPTEAPSSANSAFQVTADEQKLQVTIDYTSTAASEATQIKTALASFGITSVVSSQVESIASDKAEVLFSKKVSSGTQQRIMAQIQKVDPSIAHEQNDELSLDVLILLPK